MKYTGSRIVPLLLPLLLGCGEEGRSTGSANAPAAPPAAGSRFDPSTTGTIVGTVTWNGEVPALPREMAGVPTGTGYTWSEVPNPWAPAVDRATGGLADAVVTLEGVDPERQKAWDLPPVRVEVDGAGIRIRPGEGPPRRAGIVRPGDDVTLVSIDPRHHMLRARGAAFFTLPFPEPQKPLTRRFETPGWVDLSSGAGYYWHAAELLVARHPYHAVSDSNGRFALTGVPPGSYTLTARVRDWHVAGQERDPETGLVFRQTYAAPVEIRVPVTVRSDHESDVTVVVPASQFPAR